MGKRTWIDSDIWFNTEDLNDEERLFYIFLLTNEQRNVAGYYKVNIKRMAFDMGTTPDHIEKLLSKEQSYWMYDEETKQVLIPKFTKFNVVKSKPQIVKLNAELNALAPCRLHKAFLEAFEAVNGTGATFLIDEKFKAKADIYKNSI